MSDTHVYSDGHEVEILEYEECPTCDYGVAPLTPYGDCLNCYAIRRHYER